MSEDFGRVFVRGDENKEGRKSLRREGGDGDRFGWGRKKQRHMDTTARRASGEDPSRRYTPLSGNTLRKFGSNLPLK